MSLQSDGCQHFWGMGVVGVAESDVNILNFSDTIKTYNHGTLSSYLKPKQEKIQFCQT